MYKLLARIINKTEPVYANWPDAPDPAELWHSMITISTTEFEEPERDVITAHAWDFLANTELHPGDDVICTLRFFTDASNNLGAEIIDIQKVKEIMNNG